MSGPGELSRLQINERTDISEHNFHAYSQQNLQYWLLLPSTYQCLANHVGSNKSMKRVQIHVHQARTHLETTSTIIKSP